MLSSVNVLQTTLNSRVKFSGKGLHSGRIVNLEILPARANTGIIFERLDSQAAVPVPALASHISSTALSTTIGLGQSSVSTIEHIMAAFAGLGLHNAIVRLDAPEVPILDGSAMVFVRKILEVGLAELNSPLRTYRATSSLEIRHGDQFIRLEPSDSLEITCSIDFPHRVIGHQAIQYHGSENEFIKICRSRTFCHIRDVHAMRERGLALGGSLDNAIVLSDDGLLNEGGLHTKDEFVEHKLLDLIGDLALLGKPLIAKVTTHKPGHALHAEFTQTLLRMKDEFLEEQLMPAVAVNPTNKTRMPVFTPAIVNLG